MRLDVLGVDRSVSALFPPEVLLEKLQDFPVETVLIDGDPETDADSNATSTTRCDGVVTFAYRPSLLECDWVHSVQAGVDRFPQERFREEGVLLTNSTGIHGDAIGETVAGYMLAFARRLHEHVANQVEKRWSRPAWDEPWTIAGERACVVGVGSLGRGVVDRATGLGLDVDGVRRTPVPEPGVDRMFTPESLETAVVDARFVVLAVPLTSETEGLIDADVLAAMREDAYLINVARGSVVDQEALVRALEAGEIAGAALDVFEVEPLPESSPLWEMDEVIVTPHAGSATRQYCDHVASIVAESVRRIRAGDDPANRVC
ncbi:D-2-hydroxyacid dehydrogenase [Halobellus salinisoli]|uniref:D-2-hydroxyacid dehydrogenase n=1 Tax=Halobellus salinisoli TaxID=3108500 RepID=UPI00300B101E